MFFQGVLIQKSLKYSKVPKTRIPYQTPLSIPQKYPKNDQNYGEKLVHAKNII
jgi:hypothetical protein